MKDCVIRSSCDDKLRILLDMCAVWGWTNIAANVSVMLMYSNKWLPWWGTYPTDGAET